MDPNRLCWRPGFRDPPRGEVWGGGVPDHSVWARGETVRVRLMVPGWPCD